MFIDLALAKSHQRIISNKEDVLISAFIAAAEQSAITYLNRQLFDTAENMAAAIADGVAGKFPMVITADIKAAMLLIIGHLYGSREDVLVGVGAVELPMGSRHLLRPYRILPGV